MRLASFTHPGDDRVHVGAVLDDERILDLTGSARDDDTFASIVDLIRAGSGGLARARAMADAAAAGEPRYASDVLPLANLHLLAPIPRPSKNVFCVGLNYRSHVELNAAALGIAPEIPAQPLFFTKPPTAVIGTGAAIHLDGRVTQKLDYEVELGVIIGQGGSWIDETSALDHVFGYTLVNDVSARDVQWRSTQMFIGKGLDTYCPIGPWIVTADEATDVEALAITCSVNGEVRQEDSTAALIFGLRRIISELSRGLTLEPGDIISTGTPGGCGYQLVPPRFLAVGDVVECAAPGFGRLVNRVIAWPQGGEEQAP